LAIGGSISDAPEQPCVTFPQDFYARALPEALHLPKKVLYR
jgi:hypothetical protein